MKVHDDNGTELDASFQVEEGDDNALTILYMSRSGTSKAGTARNSDYDEGLRLVLQRLGALAATLTDAAVDSAYTRKAGLDLDARRLPIVGHAYPLRLGHLHDFAGLRVALGRAQTGVARAEGAQGGGNPNKQIRLHVGLPATAPRSVGGLQHFLAFGEPDTHFVAMLANPAIYDVETASRELVDDQWMLPAGHLSPGDRIVFWRTQGADGHRGVVAFGEVRESPQVLPESPASLAYWKGTPPTTPVRRVKIRYVRPPLLPLWLDSDATGLLDSLSVSRGQGTKPYKVSPAQWEGLVKMAGGWPTRGAATPRAVPLDPAEVPDGEYPEGAVSRIVVNHYERNPAARRECIDIYGVSCMVCGFDFERVYGPAGKGYIHVHHIVPVSAISKSYRVNPRTDLRPVCANCHAMLHATNPPTSLDDLRRLVGR